MVKEWKPGAGCREGWEPLKLPLALQESQRTHASLRARISGWKLKKYLETVLWCKLDLQSTSHALFHALWDKHSAALQLIKRSNGVGYCRRCVRACLSEGCTCCALVILAKNHWYLWQDKLAQPCGYSLSLQMLTQHLAALSEEA